jgi:hypothetical protein
MHALVKNYCQMHALVKNYFKRKIQGMSFQSGNDGRPKGARNRGSYELRERLKARPNFVDPAEYLSDIISSPTASLECKVAASGNLMPYLYSKLGAIAPQRFVEIPIAVPDFKSIDDVEKFLVHITRHVARGTLSLDHAKELADLARQWVHTHYADDELRMKIAASLGTDPNNPPTIRIEGGLPALPGTNITMPNFNGHSLELSATSGPATSDPHSHPDDKNNP